MRVVMDSILYIVQTIAIYQQDFNISSLQDVINQLMGSRFNTIETNFSKVKVLLYYAKAYFMEGEYGSIEKAENLIEYVIECLLDVIHKVNGVLFKFKAKQYEKKILKYQKIHRECQILMAIAIVINNKCKMKLFK